MRAAALLVVDVILAVAAIVSVLILLTGGGVFYVAEHRISAYHATNLLWGFFLLGVPRFALFPDSGFFGFSWLRGRRIAAHCRRICDGFYLWSKELPSRSTGRIVVAILLVSLSVKVLNAWFYYGFYSGDDVEVHEMSLASLLDWPDYHPWNLRSPFYPMVFIYPVQRIAYELGVQDEGLLVFAGRLVVVVISTLVLLVLYHATLARYRSTPVALIALAILASSQLHTTFAATVLPRSVAALFCVLAFWLLARYRHYAAAIVSGFCLGVATTFRFGEGVFVLACAADLLSQRRWPHAGWVVVVSGCTVGLILGISDVVYYDEAFSSLKAVVRYTLIDRLSSRGFQPFYYYLSAVGSWASIPFLFLVAKGARLSRDGVVFWVVVPIVTLSLLPHKEARYLVPVMPFLAMLAALAIWRWLESLHTERTSGWLQSATALVLVVVSSWLFEVDGMRFRRTESSVDAARVIASHRETVTAGIQDVWTAGGDIYLWRLDRLENLSPGEPRNRDLSDLEFVSLRDSPDAQDLLEGVGSANFHEIELPDRQYWRYRLFANGSRE